MTQDEWVLKYLQEYGEITPLDAFREFAIMRLSACIHRLRKEYIIDTEYKTEKNRFGVPVTFANYVYKKPFLVEFIRDSWMASSCVQYAKNKDTVEEEFYKWHDKKCEIVNISEEK